MLSYYLFLFLAVASVTGEVVNINNGTDTFFERINSFHRSHGRTTAVIPPGVFKNVSYSESILTGVDSLVRTDDCTLTIQDSTTRFDFHYGLGLWLQTFRGINLDGLASYSAYYRIRSNSVHIAFTVHNETRCYVTVDDLAYEKLEDVEFGSSLSPYDGVNVDSYFQEVVLPTYNKILHYLTPKVERHLQGICHHRSHQLFNYEEALPQIVKLVHNFY